jgi:membrane associated rhomboid family serine protease
MLFPVLLLAAVVIYLVPRDERTRLLRAAIALLRDAKAVATRPHAASDRFHAELRKRQPHAAVTAAIITLNVAIFIGAAMSSGRLADSRTLIAWGASVGPRTTNGEWWRLIASAFIHAGLFHLLINMATLAQIGVILERLVGRVLFAAVYAAAAIFGTLAALAAYPIDLSVGASASICGLLGLLAATSTWLQRQRSEVRLPLIVLQRLAAVSAVFVVWNLFNGDMPLRAETSGFIVGAIAGLVLTGRVDRAHPPVRRVAAAAALAALLAIAFAIPVRGIADVRPEVAGLVALEQRTAAAYDSAVEQFRKGRMSGEAVAQMVAGAIVPALQAADAHLKDVRYVPAIHAPLVTDARDYLRLRTQSWQLRAEGLRTMGRAPDAAGSLADPIASARRRARATASYRATTLTLAKAEAAERASLAALERTRQETSGASKPPLRK